MVMIVVMIVIVGIVIVVVMRMIAVIMLMIGLVVGMIVVAVGGRKLAWCDRGCRSRQTLPLSVALTSLWRTSRTPARGPCARCRR